MMEIFFLEFTFPHVHWHGKTTYRNLPEDIKFIFYTCTLMYSVKEVRKSKYEKSQTRKWAMVSWA